MEMKIIIKYYNYYIIIIAKYEIDYSFIYFFFFFSLLK